MDINVAEQVLDELFPALEAVETQSAAILQFLIDRGLATDEELTGSRRGTGLGSLQLRVPRTVRFSIRVVSSNRGTDDFTRDH
jgi:hypothetical protein